MLSMTEDYCMILYVHLFIFVPITSLRWTSYLIYLHFHDSRFNAPWRWWPGLGSRLRPVLSISRWQISTDHLKISQVAFLQFLSCPFLSIEYVLINFLSMYSSVLTFFGLFTFFTFSFFLRYCRSHALRGQATCLCGKAAPVLQRGAPEVKSVLKALTVGKRRRDHFCG